jgi:hypothetical protein
MSYLINKTNGQLILTLIDGTADGPNINPGLNTTDINLFGKNYPTYGEYQNENFIKLLENFSNSTPPTSPIRGELWYDTSTNLLKVYFGTNWKPVSPMLVSNTSPTVSATTVVTGTQWWDTINDQLYTYNGTDWLLIAPPYSKLDGKSGAFSDTVYDTNGGKHTVVKMFTNGNVSAIASYDTTFTPNVAIVGFANIATGWTVNSAINAQFVGTATNSLSLGDILAAQYARKDIDETFSGNISIASNNLQVNATPSSDINVTNTVSGANINFYATVSGSATRVVYVNGVTGTLQVSNIPSSSNDVTNKSYVDASIAVAISPLATIASPTFTGIPAAPTATIGANTTQIATTQFVTIATEPLASKASPAFTGIPTAPTAAPGTSTIQLATTAFVTTAVEAQRFRYTVSTELPIAGTGAEGDFWFQIQPSA